MREAHAPRALEERDGTAGDDQERSHDTESTAETHENAGHEHRDTHRGRSDLARRARRELLHLGLKPMIREDVRDGVRRRALLLAAGGSDADVLQQMVQIFLSVRHEGSASYLSCTAGIAVPHFDRI